MTHRTAVRTLSLTALLLAAPVLASCSSDTEASTASTTSTPSTDPAAAEASTTSTTGVVAVVPVIKVTSFALLFSRASLR